MKINKYSLVDKSIIFLSLIILVLVYIQPIGNRIGDGMEYYAMLLSFIHSGLPYSTAIDFSFYDNYVANTSSLGFLNSEYLKNGFPMLLSSSGQDFPHFWFYSLLATPIGIILEKFSIDIGYSFTILNIILLIITSYITYKEYNKVGLLSLLIILLCSPIIWFITKAHTEFFTVTFSIAGIIYFTKSRYLLASLFFAIISTQNPPFAIISLLLISYDMFNNRFKIFNIKFLSLSSIIIIIIALHPLYYFLRLGVVTPQFLMGAANDSPTFHRMITWFIDPDLGLFFNWPLGLILLFVGLYYFLNMKNKKNYKQYIYSALFYFLYVFLLSYAQSKTGNLNHGATVNISRYALWYVALFFPLLLILTQWLIDAKLSVCKRNIFLLVIIFYASINIMTYFPKKNETYVSQTLTSKIFYKNFTRIWEPEPEIFVERALNQEGIPNHWAIFRDNKILINRIELEKISDKDEIPNILNNILEIKPNSVYEKAKKIKPSENFFYMNAPFEISEGFLKEYKAKIELVSDSKYICVENEDNYIPLRITNTGSVTWPTKNSNNKNIFLSYHIEKEDGSIIVTDGIRTSFPHDISNGVTIPIKLNINCNKLVSGKYILIVDLVHEHVLWFGAKDSNNLLSIEIEKID